MFIEKKMKNYIQEHNGLNLFLISTWDRQTNQQYCIAGLWLPDWPCVAT
jgi:hypothetical protein